MFSSPTGSPGWGAGWGFDQGLWLRQRDTQGSCLPPLSAYTIDCTRLFHFPCFLQNHLTGVVLISDVGFLSGLLRFALLTSTAQDYLPKSKQNGLTLLGRGCREAVWVTLGSVLGGSAGEETYMCDRRLTLTHGHGKIHPCYVGVDSCGTDPNDPVYKLHGCTRVLV